MLDEILEGVRADLEQRQREVALDRLKEMARQAPSPRDALAALTGDDVAVIAEVKRGSPSHPAMAEIADPAASRVLSRSPLGYAHVPAGVTAPVKALVDGWG